MLSLIIEIQSLEFKRGIVNDDDIIMINVTALPGGQKQTISFEAFNIKRVCPSITININEKTEKILFVFRKKSFTESNPIIASTVIQSGQFPINFEDEDNSEMKFVDILEPLQHLTKGSERKIYGSFYIQFSLTYEISSIAIPVNLENCGNNEIIFSKMDFSFNSGSILSFFQNVTIN